MNILCIDQFPQLGGAQRCFLDLSRGFCAYGWRVRVAIPGEGPYAEKLRAAGCTVEVLRSCPLSSSHKSASDGLRYARWCPQAARAINHAAAEFHPDLLYVNGPRLLPAAAYVSRRKGIPLIFHAHNRLLQKAALALAGASLRFARAQVIACCRYVADSLERYVPTDRLAIVYNGIADLSVSRALKSHTKPIGVVGVIGRIESEKGQLDFIRAVRILHSEFPNCRFRVIGAPLFSNGDQYYRQVLEESRGLPVTFIGWQEDISLALTGLDCLVVPSLQFDATPRVVLEAFSSHVPVIAFASGGIPEIIEDGETGFLVEIRSPEALAAGMRDFLKADGESISRVIANARAAWHNRFRLDQYQEQITDTIVRSTQKASVQVT